jgi:hypothetical protein
LIRHRQLPHAGYSNLAFGLLDLPSTLLDLFPSDIVLRQSRGIDLHAHGWLRLP